MNQKESAVARVLQAPELVAIILAYCYNDCLFPAITIWAEIEPKLVESKWNILGLRLVNKLFHKEASRCAFKHCNSPVIAYLWKLKQEGLSDYGYLVNSLSLHKPFSGLADGTALNLENLKMLRVVCVGDFSGIIPRAFGMCKKLEDVAWVQPESSAKCVPPMLQIAPTTRCHLGVGPGRDSDAVFKMVSEHPQTEFSIFCYYNSLLVHDHDVVFGEFCESAAAYPAAARSFTSFDLLISADELIQSSEDVLSLFELVSHRLDLLQVTLRNVNYRDREFVQHYLAPVLRMCTSASSFTVVFDNKFTVDQFEPWASDTVDHWRNQVFQFTPDDADVSFVIKAERYPHSILLMPHFM